MRAENYSLTIKAAFLGYVVQAIVNNFLPLLFIQMQSEFGIPLSQITLLITINFLVQLTVDLTSAPVIERIGYRASMIISNASVIAGLLLLTFLPGVLPGSFAGILIAVCVYAVGGGLQEVLVSPIVEACPTDNKEAAMSLLHSFYCWGHMGVVLLSTLYFHFAGIANWRVLAGLWCLIPLVDLVLFSFVPIACLESAPEKQAGPGSGLKALFSQKFFWIMLLMMLCSGASEQAVSQWASAFAEKGLGVSKQLGDLLGPMLFALCMGTSRAIYGVKGHRIDLKKFMVTSVVLCLLSYIVIIFSQNPFITLIGCGLTGFSVGIFWPGTFSMASAGIRNGGTLLFAFLALAGDLGCSGGPTLAGTIMSVLGTDMRTGIGAAIVFPVLMGVGLILAGSSKVDRPEVKK
ncbi:MAG: MFS transporter [Lachnospiraceae bacterium]|nr:MFS transporter [Lachnospiraceae bacterium]